MYLKSRHLNVDAIRVPALEDSNVDALLKWLDDRAVEYESNRDGVLTIHNKELTIEADPGDWLIYAGFGEVLIMTDTMVRAFYIIPEVANA